MSELQQTDDQAAAESLLRENQMFSEDQTVRFDPYPLYEACRAIGPITEEPHTGVLVVTRHQDVLDGERRHEDFSSAIGALGAHVGDAVPQRPDLASCPFGSADLSAEIDEWRETTELELIPILTLDPPEHTEYRALVNKLFSSDRKNSIEPQLRKSAHDLVDLFVDKGEAEWMADFSMPYTYFAMNDVMDFPRADEEAMFDAFRERVANPVEGIPTGQAEDGEFIITMSLGDDRFTQYLTERRECPMSDVISDIATARFKNGELPQIEDLVAISSVMYAAGQVTTMHLIGTMMQIVATDQALQQRLREEPALIENFVSECLRLQPPVQGMFRIAKRDTKLGDVDIPAGKIIYLCYAAANRDPEIFENPEMLNLERKNASKAITFGAGRHFCPGQPIAKLEARITFQEVLKRMENIRLKNPDENIRQPAWFIVRGPEQLKIVFDKIA